MSDQAPDTQNSDASINILRRRAWLSLYATGLVGCVDSGLLSTCGQALTQFADQASDAERSAFFEDAPAEFLAAYLKALSVEDKVSLIKLLIGLSPELFSNLLEGL